jgi:HD-like signal output (HDOD) protein
MRRILFVDDEPQLLSGLENALRKQRKHWDMRFVSSGEAALRELEQGVFDVIVSDMRMPGMDGPVLLAHVKKHYPRTARFVLSGQADRQALFRSIPVTQQFLNKPCDSETLKGAIDRVCTLQDRVHDPEVQSLVGGIESLPASPNIYLELTGALERPQVGLGELAAIVEKDPALTAKVLQLANSAFFGSGQRTSSVKAAVTYLGAELLRVLVLVASVFMRTDKLSRSGGRLLADFQRHSILLAQLMPKFVVDRKRAELAVVGALLHDVGLMVFATKAPNHAEAMVRRLDASGQSMSDVERELGSPTHSMVGALLLGAWGLPFDLVEVAAYHHVPSEASSHTPADLLMAVHAAEILVHAIESGDADDPTQGIDMVFAERVGLLPKLAEWRSITEVVLTQAQAEKTGAVERT